MSKFFPSTLPTRDQTDPFIKQALIKTPPVARDYLLIIASMILLAFCILLTHIFVLNTQFSVVSDTSNLRYIWAVACIVTGIVIVFQPSRARHRLIFLAIFLAAFTLLNAVDLTFMHYFRQPVIAVYPYLPSSGATVATLPTYAASLHQYVAAPFLVSSLLLTMPAFVLFHLLGYRARALRLPAFLSTAIALTASIAPIDVHSSTAPSDPLTASILGVDPNITLKSLRGVDRSHSFAVLEAPKYKPRTIVLIINENTSFFNRSAEDSRISLIDRIIDLSGDEHLWNIYSNALSNSPCTDVSLPSILTGSGSHESFAKLHQMPFVFDIAKARGYRTAFYTSAIMEWANLSTFLSQAKIDSVLTGSQTGLPLVSDLAVDDIAVMKRLGTFVREASEQEYLFIVVYPHGMHTPYQSESELAFPPNLTDRRSRGLYILENNHRILFDALRDMGRLAGALIIVTADHGEPMPGSSRGPRFPRVENTGEETLRVPLLIKEPSDLPAELAAGLRSNAASLVSNVDIAPTIADLLGVQLRGGLTYSGYSLLRQVPETRLSVATSINEWRSWPRGSLALARGTDRFTCHPRVLCTYYSISPAEEAAMAPFDRRMKYLSFMSEAQKLPIIAQNLSRIYHAHLGVVWSPPGGVVRVATRGDLFSSLGELLAQPPGNAVLHAPAGHAAGHIMYGPYWMLPPGQFTGEVSLEIGAGGVDGEHLCTVDIYDGVKIVGAKEIRQDSAPGAREVVIPFSVPEDVHGKRYELRLWCAGKVSITINRVAFAQVVATTSRDDTPSPVR